MKSAKGNVKWQARDFDRNDSWAHWLGLTIANQSDGIWWPNGVLNVLKLICVKKQFLPFELSTSSQLETRMRGARPQIKLK
jgi:hypothetical protein